jgi:hypothetical protein
VTSGGSATKYTLTINADNPFTTSSGASGTWVAKRADMTLTAGTSSYVGRQSAKGIGTKNRPGQVYVNGQHAGTWYAVRTSQLRNSV